jgi:hypothetical protein
MERIVEQLPEFIVCDEALSALDVLTDIPRLPDGLKPGSSLPASSATVNCA